MRLLVGDDTGLVKDVTCARGDNSRDYKKHENKKNKSDPMFGQQMMERSILSMQFAGPTDNEESQVAMLTRSGDVECWDIDKQEVLWSFSPLSDAELEVDAGIVGFAVLPQEQKVLTVSEYGVVKVRHTTDEDDADAEDQKRWEFDTKVKDLRHAVVSPLTQSQVALAGKEALLKVWDINKQTCTFAARNVPHDFLELRLPVWVNNLAYSPLDENVLVTGTAYHQVRMFDVRVEGRRAVMDLEVGEWTVSAVHMSNRSSFYIYAGDGVGNVFKIDTRVKKVVGKYKGAAGAIRSIATHPTEDYLATTSLDRNVRVYDLSSRQRIVKKYLIQKQNAVLFFTQDKPVEEETVVEPVAVDDDERVWKLLDKKAEGEEDSSSDEDVVSASESSSDSDDMMSNIVTKKRRLN
jgi:ribosome biogenesis protein NSA1